MITGVANLEKQHALVDCAIRADRPVAPNDGTVRRGNRAVARAPEERERVTVR
jgi:hypothetical protein